MGLSQDSIVGNAHVNDGAGNAAHQVSASIPFDKTAGLEAIAAVVGGVPRSEWSSALRLWYAHMQLCGRESTRALLAAAEAGPAVEGSSSGLLEIPDHDVFFEKVIGTNANLAMRASVIRQGKHDYNQMDIMPVLGSAVVQGFPWQFNMKEPDIEVVAIVMHHHVVLGIVLDPANYFGGSGIARESVLGGQDFDGADVALRPSTSYMLLQVARLAAGADGSRCSSSISGKMPSSNDSNADAVPGVGSTDKPLAAASDGGGPPLNVAAGGVRNDTAQMPPAAPAAATSATSASTAAAAAGSTAPPQIILPLQPASGSLGVVVDGCAGRGTIPLEAAIGHQGFGIAGEYDADSANLMQRVFSAERAKVADAMRWDARALPLRDGVADHYISDLPFGLKCLSSKEIAKLYPGIVQEAARVLVPGIGVLVALTALRGPLLLKRALAAGPWCTAGPLFLAQGVNVNIGGLMCEIVVARRLRASSSSSSSEWPAPGLSAKALRKAKRLAQFGAAGGGT